MEEQLFDMDALIPLEKTFILNVLYLFLHVL